MNKTRMLLGRVLALLALATYLVGPVPAVADDQAANPSTQEEAIVQVDEGAETNEATAETDGEEPSQVTDESPSDAPSDVQEDATNEPGESDLPAATEEPAVPAADESEAPAADEPTVALEDLPAGAASDVDDQSGLPSSPSAAKKLIGKSFAVRSKKNGSFALGIKGSSIDKLAVAEIQVPSSALSQRWHFVDAGQGFVRIINLGSGMALDVSYSKASKGQVIWQYLDNASTAQRWYPVEVSSGSYIFISAVGGTGAESGWYVLDIYAGTMKAGQPVKLWSYNKSLAQQWTLTEDKTERVVAAQDIKAFAKKHAGTLTNGQNIVLARAPEASSCLTSKVAPPRTRPTCRAIPLTPPLHRPGRSRRMPMALSRS